MDANTFFAILKRFCDSWKAAEADNIKREKLRKAQEEKEEQENNNRNINQNVLDKNAQNNKKNNAALIASELKIKINNRRPINHYNPEEVKVCVS